MVEKNHWVDDGVQTKRQQRRQSLETARSSLRLTKKVKLINSNKVQFWRRWRRLNKVMLDVKPQHQNLTSITLWNKKKIVIISKLVTIVVGLHCSSPNLAHVVVSKLGFYINLQAYFPPPSPSLALSPSLATKFWLISLLTMRYKFIYVISIKKIIINPWRITPS